MLLLVFVLMIVAGAFVVEVSCSDGLECLGMFSYFIGIVAVFTSLCVIAYSYITVDGYVERMNTRYEMLVYQYKNDIYDNDNDLGKRDLMIDIQNWNEDLSARRARQDNFWIGIYIPNIYDQFEYVSLEK